MVVEDGGTSVGSWAFDSCADLRKVTLSDTVTHISNGAFVDCTDLVYVDLGNSLRMLAGTAFSGCSNLAAVVFPISLYEINTYAFDGCTALTDVYYKGSESDRKNMYILIAGNAAVGEVAIWHYQYTTGSEIEISTVNGAQIRTSGNQGLRFISSIDKTVLPFFRVVEYGTVLIPTADLTDISELVIGATLNGHAIAKVAAKNLYEVTDTTITFTAVITDIADKNYAREYTARAYAILDDGTVIYADTGTSRSIYKVAQRGLESATESEANKAIFQAIVDAVEKA